MSEWLLLQTFLFSHEVPQPFVNMLLPLGAAATAALAFSTGEPLPSLSAALGLLAIGATGYGLSLRFYLLAQRAFGAARTGSVFAFAPFIGAAGAFALGERSATALMAVGGGLMVLGVLLPSPPQAAKAAAAIALSANS